MFHLDKCFQGRSRTGYWEVLPQGNLHSTGVPEQPSQTRRRGHAEDEGVLFLTPQPSPLDHPPPGFFQGRNQLQSHSSLCYVEFSFTESRAQWLLIYASRGSLSQPPSCNKVPYDKLSQHSVLLPLWHLSSGDGIIKCLVSMSPCLAY